MVDVFLTIDTEVGPVSSTCGRPSIQEEMRRDIYGCTPRGEFGIRFIMDCLAENGLKGVFFVEALFGRLLGTEYLREITDVIRNGGHDVQLHLHTEWLSRIPNSLCSGKTGSKMKDFTEAEQACLIAECISTMKACGVERICAFRAGGFGANFATLRALFRNGVPYDTSHNECWLGTTCDLPTETPLLQPRKLHGVYEFPIAFFEDWPGHYRHAQVGACSSDEMEHALLSAAAADWHSFVILCHSFELIKRPSRLGRMATPDDVVVRRFRSLCRFLAEHRSQFRTTTFAEVDPLAIPTVNALAPLRSGMSLTARRCAEQVLRRQPR